jgi:hypothetical protein
MPRVLLRLARSTTFVDVRSALTSSLLPMELTNDSVLDMFRSDLLNPQALERALSKLEARLTMAPDDACVSAIETEQRRLQSELAQLTAP